MADTTLVPQIIELLQTQSNQSCSTADISRKLKVHKKQINVELYRLQKQGVTKKIQNQPPLWQLQDACFSRNIKPNNHRSRQIFQSPRYRGKKSFGRNQGARSRGSRPGSHNNKYRQPDLGLMQKIVMFLESQNCPKKSIDIAKAHGFSTSSEINPSLYGLEKQGRITRVSENPVMWAHTNLQEGAGYSGLEVSPSGYQNSMLISTDPSSMNFPADEEMDDEESLSSLIVSEGLVNPLSNDGSSFVGESSSYAMNVAVSDTGQCLHSERSDSSQSQQVDQNFVVIKQEMSNSSHELQQNSDPRETTAPEYTCDQESQKFASADIKIEPSSSLSPSGMDVTSMMPQRMSLSNASSPPQDVEMNSIDHALSTLLDLCMQMAKPFIIAKKMEIPEAEVDNILQECKRLKYVSFQNNVCILSKKGEDYIRQKLNRSEKNINSLNVVVPQITVSNIATYNTKQTGMPMSPLELVNQQNGTFAPTNTQVNVTSNDSVFRPGGYPSLPSNISNPQITPDLRLPFSSGPRSLPLAPQGHQKTKDQVKTPSSTVTGPIPLMQVDVKASPINRLMKLSQTSFRSLPLQQNVSMGTRTVAMVEQSSNNAHHLSLHNSSAPHLSITRNFESLPVDTSTTKSGLGTQTMLNTRLKQSGPGITETRPSSGNSVFRPPVPPLDLVRQQLKKTEISPVRGVQTTTSSGTVSNLNPNNSKMTPANSANFGMNPPFLNLQQRSSPNLTPDQPQSLPVMGTRTTMALSGPQSLDLSSESFAAVNKNPVSALMEYAQSRHKVARIEVISQSGPSHRPRFVMGAYVGDQQYSKVTCTNKKDGRKEAADMALRSLIASGQYNTEKPSTTLVPSSQMTHFDKVAALTHQQFNTLVAGISENFAGRKVIAGLVMKTSDSDIGTVISLGTGNRCITGHQMSLEGNTVNDSHAEIITRRGFIRFLYKKLLFSEPNTPTSLFETSPSGKLRVRQGITFHLYISTAPCGDGALFSPRDAASNNSPLQTLNDRTHHPTFTSNVQGLLRTKMEGGEGTIPIESDFTGQTFDGIQRGERLRTMSCTDKICRWNVVGMQGALLSHFLDPIYLDSLTLGFLFDPGHLARAVCCRVDKGEAKIDSCLPDGYHLNHPWLGRVTAVEPSRETQKTKSLSINWCYGDERAEVTDGTQGLCYTSIEKGFFSRCTKKNLYDSFKQCCEKFGRSDLLNASCYNKAKMAATDFVQAKQAMVKKFAENKYGPWVSKPIEEEMFS